MPGSMVRGCKNLGKGETAGSKAGESLTRKSAGLVPGQHLPPSLLQVARQVLKQVGSLDPLALQLQRRRIGAELHAPPARRQFPQRAQGRPGRLTSELVASWSRSCCCTHCLIPLRVKYVAVIQVQ